ncbi:MAG: phosphate uptake regulator PhoU, partial [Desulfurococcales archaeon]|nr:phosphate uptake regulator PhoU [Desulfurococcales archaeon]
SNKELLKSVRERDDLVDKLYLLVVRQLNDILMGRRNPKDLGLQSLPETLYVFLGAKSIERVADHATLIAGHGYEAVGSIPDIVVGALEEATDIFERSARSFIYLNKEAAMKVASQIENFWERQSDVLKKLNPLHSPETVYPIVDSIRRIAGYSLDLAESVIDIVTIRLMEREK